MDVVQAYKFALDPTVAQTEALWSHCGGQRKAYNWGLNRVKTNLAERDAERARGVPEDQLTPCVNWSAYGLRRAWNVEKHRYAVNADTGEPWWPSNSKEAYESGLANLATALGNWRASRDGTRAGRRVRFPRFKTRRKTRPTCSFTTGFHLSTRDRRHVKLPKIGHVRTHESTRKLARRVETGTAHIVSATVSHQQGRWFVSFTCRITRFDPPPRQPGSTVGVDLGITNLAVCSRPVPDVTDENGLVPNPRYLRRAQRYLRRAQRRASRRQSPDRRIGREASKRWRKAQRRVTRMQHRVANQRRDGQHQLTTALTRRFGAVVLEDLNVRGMLGNRRLAREISDAGWGEIRRQVGYKTTWRGGTLVLADRWYPSSKTCSACGVVKAKLRLGERTFRCGDPACGLVLDRDLNAARNLAALVESKAVTSTQGCWAETVNTPDGSPCKTSRAGSGYRHGKAHVVNAAPQGAASTPTATRGTPTGTRPS